MTGTDLTVYIVDDDDALRESLAFLLAGEGFRTATFSSAEEFLAACRPGDAGCLVLDVRMPGMSGLELQARLAADQAPLPVIVISGHGDIPMAVRAVRSGALDFLEKPVSDEVLLMRIRAALAQARELAEARAQRDQLQRRIARLTPREHEVMRLVVVGHPNKQIAAELGITEKTVEVHRKHVMHKLGLRNAVSLARLGLVLNVVPPESVPPAAAPASHAAAGTDPAQDSKTPNSTGEDHRRAADSR